VIHCLFCLAVARRAATARALVEAFEAARAAGRERARRGDLLIEVPAYFHAKRLLACAAALRVKAPEGQGHEPAPPYMSGKEHSEGPLCCSEHCTSSI